MKLGLDIEDIKNMKKSSLKRILNKAILNKAIQRLNALKENHSKVKGIIHSKLKMQKIILSQIDIEYPEKNHRWYSKWEAE